MKTVVAILVSITTCAFAQTPSPLGKRPFTFEDMMKLKRVGAPVPSADGKWVVFDCVDVDLHANTKISHLWIVPATGGESRRLNPTSNHEERPRFSPDGKRLIWTSKATDPTQIWMCDFDSGSGMLVGKPHHLTNIATGADGGIWSPDGKNIVFVSAVYPDCKDDACNKQRDEELKKSKVKAKIFSRLFYRHWSSFTEFKRSHLFLQTVEAPVPGGGNGTAPSTAATTARDLTPGDHDVPPFSLGGQDMYAISPDSQEVAYTSNVDEVEATSTNNEIFVVPISGDTAKKISTNHGSATPLLHRGTGKKTYPTPCTYTTPLYSPDGRYLAWRSQARAGFEADKWRLLVQDRQSGKIRDLTENFDHSAGSFAFDQSLRDIPDGSGSIIYFVAEERGGTRLYAVPARPEADGNLGPRLAENEDYPPSAYADDLCFGGSTLFYSRMSALAPNEIWRTPFKKGELGMVIPRAVTHINDALLSQIDMQPLESFTFKGANDEEVQGFMVKPPGFIPSKKYPLKFLLHGGPQGAWGNEWTYRWNAELFAASGNYVVVMINFHGSTGYGQKFTDSISGDWGGKPFVDVMKGLDYVEKTYPIIDKNREAALGASYGGYMANWLLGHTNRFKCIVSHDGMFNAESAYGTTEEIWFMNWEFGGPPWKKRDVYRKWSPNDYAANFK
jgi:dipeptidyl aminopeptidase/acylaminoacyl peptidase